MGHLNSLTVQKATKPGLLSDGNGLYLRIKPGGTKGWVFRFSINKRARSMGLGSVDLITLAEARIKATECRKLLLEGKDPINVRALESANRDIESKKALTFDQCADKYIESHRPSWKHPKHAQQWTNSIRTYASPVIGNLPIAAVDTTLVMQILEPIWSTKNETASRVRSRIEVVIAWATVRGYRTDANPAIWRNHLDKLLPKRSRVQKVEHHPALPFEEVGAFIESLRKREGTAARALEFLILTATRTSETLNAEWSEINFDEKIWVIPDKRMKAGIEHRIPLSPRALDLLEQMRSVTCGEFIFPGARPGRPLSNVAMLKVLERMKVDAIVTHGFRSTFRDWAAERTNFPREVCEQALAHTVRDKVESAYRRGDLLLKRRLLMDQWAAYCNLPAHSSNVINLSSPTVAASV